MKLTSETRWHRCYELEEPKTFYHESKFEDGSAFITMEELARDWPSWSNREKSDFAQEVGKATFEHLPDVLRFIMANGDERSWSGIALEILHYLPRDESVPFLLAACRRADIQQSTNLFQALSKSGAPEAHALIRERLERIWEHPDLWKPGKSFLAADAVFLIKHLIALGEHTPDMAAKYQALISHPDEWHREFAKGWLNKHFEVAR